MRVCKSIVAALVVLLSFAVTPASAATGGFTVHILNQWGEPISWAPDATTEVLRWEQGTWNSVGDYSCHPGEVSVPPPPVSNQFGVVPIGPGTSEIQGCFVNGLARISRAANGVSLSARGTYMLKVNLPGYYQGVAAWQYLHPQGASVYVSLAPLDVEIFSSHWVDPETGFVSVWNWVANSGDATRWVQLFSEGRFAGVTSKDWTVGGRQYLWELPPGTSWAPSYTLIPERWYPLPNWRQGQVFGEQNCLRMQATFIEGGDRIGVVAGETCVTNYE